MYIDLMSLKSSQHNKTCEMSSTFPLSHVHIHVLLRFYHTCPAGVLRGENIKFLHFLSIYRMQCLMLPAEMFKWHRILLYKFFAVLFILSSTGRKGSLLVDLISLGNCSVMFLTLASDRQKTLQANWLICHTFILIPCSGESLSTVTLLEIYP